ncbi:MAG: phosphopantothenoylcysteine decarboxylase, partial [Firmicutes bacterium]|nr:phosphopantothenoylcysteine decarboxylase [Bacillota bacterium]
ADLILIAPATANIIGKIAYGIADDFLSTVVMAAAGRTPVYIAPAMNTNMYENPIVQANIEKLAALGYKLIEPKESLLACGVTGKGALADVDVIVDIIEKAEI